jgi:hypothetical protein
VTHSQNVAAGNALAGRLIEGEWHDELMVIIDKLEHIPAHRSSLKPSQPIDHLTVFVYGKGGAENLSVDGARGQAKKYEFSAGASVTRKRKSPYTVMIQDESMNQLGIVRVRENSRSSWHWKVFHVGGFRGRSGQRAGTRMRGYGPDKSIG